MYLLFVDESGTHGGSPVFVLGGLAVHELDAHPLQRRLEAVVADHVSGSGTETFELHASEMRNAKKPRQGHHSPWEAIPRQQRLHILDEAYEAITRHQPVDPQFPVLMFGVVMDHAFLGNQDTEAREQFAYEVLLNKFDVMIKRANRNPGDVTNKGLVIHDRRVVERDIQRWTANWRVAAGKLHRLNHLADVPLFSDSRASRLIQAADLVSYATYTYYASQSALKDAYINKLWPLFDHAEGVLHGLVHYTPDYRRGSCWCRPCQERLSNESQQMALPSLE